MIRLCFLKHRKSSHIFEDFRTKCMFLRTSQLMARCCSKSYTSSDSVEVYNGSLTSRIRAVKFFSLSSSVLGLGAQPFLFLNAPNLGTSTVIGLFTFVGFFTFVTPLLLHAITKKYVTRICFNAGTENYTATVLDIIMREKMVTFTTNEVVVPDVPGIFTSFHAKGIPLFIEPSQFSKPEHYAKIMGYDKPLDFQLKDTADNSSSTKRTQKH